MATNRGVEPSRRSWLATVFSEEMTHFVVLDESFAIELRIDASIEHFARSIVAVRGGVLKS